LVRRRLGERFSGLLYGAMYHSASANLPGSIYRHTLAHNGLCKSARMKPSLSFALICKGLLPVIVATIEHLKAARAMQEQSTVRDT